VKWALGIIVILLILGAIFVIWGEGEGGTGNAAVTFPW